MKALVNRKAFLECIHLAASVALSRTPKPVLTCALITAKDKVVRVQANDMEVSIAQNCAQCDIQREGRILIPAAKLAELVDSLPDETITIEETAKETIAITGADSKFKVFGYNPDDFPPGVTEPKEDTFTVACAEFAQLLALSAFAAADQMTRYALNAVLVERHGTSLVAVATDGHRLALANGTCLEGGEKVKALLSNKTVRILERILSKVDVDTTIRVFISPTRSRFELVAGDNVLVELNGSMVEGTFPSHSDVIPKTDGKPVLVNRLAFLSAAKRARLLTNQESKGIRLSVVSDTVTLSSRAPQMGESSISIKAEESNGTNIEIGFNPDYLISALQAATADRVAIYLSAPNRPGRFDFGKSMTYVVMPLALT